MNRRLVFAMVLGVLAGCSREGVHFNDDIDLTFDFHLFDRGRAHDNLNSPYVKGASFTMFAWRDDEDMDLAASWADSLDPSVLSVRNTLATDDHVAFEARAVAEGTTEVVVYRDAEGKGTWGSTRVQVLAPDRAELTFAGPYFIHADTREYRVGGPVNVLAGGTATFLVQYYRGNRLLHGVGALLAQAGDADVEVGVARTYLFEDREWVQVTPRTPGNHAVTLSVAGTPVATLQVRAVTDPDVAFIELRRQSESGEGSGHILAVLAIGYTVDGQPVYGIDFDWSLDGVREKGEGDLYKYEYDPHSRSELRASYGTREQRVNIHADDGWVSSTNRVGCSAGAGAPAGMAGAVLLAALAQIAVRVGGRRGTS